MNLRTRHLAGALALACAMSLTACGGDDASNDSSSGAVSVPDAPADPSYVDDAPVDTSIKAYVDTYYTNVADDACHATVDSNAGVRAVKGMLELWTPASAYVDADTYSGSGLASATDEDGNACAAVTASTWDGSAETGGTRLNSAVLGANIKYVVDAAASRTSAQSEAAWMDDKLPKDYTMAEGAGPLTASWRSGLGATAEYTVQAGASSASVTSSSEGSADGTLGQVYTLAGSSGVGNYATGNTTKYFYKYARPYMWSAYGGSIDIVVPALQSSQTTTAGLSAAKNGGFASGHTAEFVRRSAAMAYALPERFQEFYARALEGGENRILAGVHSPLDVIGGRIVGLAAAAANLYSAENTGLADSWKNTTVTADFKAAARAQALAAMQSAAGTSSWKDFYDYAHSGQSTDTSASNYDKYADHDANLTQFERRMNIGMADHAVAATDAAAIVPKGAEALLETRYPYLSASQRRVVLKTTEFASGYPVMNDAEGWGRLDMFKAGDGYGAFNGLVTLTLDTSLGGFANYDIWRNDIGGDGKLKLKGDGTLKLAGGNSYSGGTEIAGATFEAGSASAFGNGDVYLGSGAIVVSASEPLVLKKKYTQLDGTTLTVTLGANGQGRIDVGDLATIQGGSLNVKFASGYTPTAGDKLKVITAGTRKGTFDTVSVDGWNASASYSATGVSVQLVSAKS